MSEPRGIEIHTVVYGQLEDGKTFIRFDSNYDNGTCMFAWDLEDAFKWMNTKVIAEDCEFIDLRGAA